MPEVTLCLQHLLSAGPQPRAIETCGSQNGVPLNGVQAEVQLCKYLKARLDQGYAEGASAADAGATEAELRGEVAEMLAEVETLKQRHRRKRRRPAKAADRKREPSGEL